MSKSGLYAHFRSKEELQIATVDEAARIFLEEVVEPALAAPPGLGQLPQRCARRSSSTSSGARSRAAASSPARPSRWAPVRVRSRSASSLFQTAFVDLIRGFVATAIEQGELPADEDPRQLAFELNGMILATDASFVLQDDPAVIELARRVVHRRLGVRPLVAPDLRPRRPSGAPWRAWWRGGG